MTEGLSRPGWRPDQSRALRTPPPDYVDPHLAEERIFSQESLRGEQGAKQWTKGEGFSAYEAFLGYLQGKHGKFGGAIIERVMTNLKQAKAELDTTGIINEELLDTIPNLELREQARQILVKMRQEKEQTSSATDLSRAPHEMEIPADLQGLANPFNAYRMEDLLATLRAGKHGRFGSAVLTEKYLAILGQIESDFKSSGELNENLLQQIKNRELRDGVKFTIQQQKDAAQREADLQDVRRRIANTPIHVEHTPEVALPAYDPQAASNQRQVLPAAKPHGLRERVADLWASLTG